MDSKQQSHGLSRLKQAKRECRKGEPSTPGVDTTLGREYMA